MSYNITGTTITLTRGDTFEALVSATKRDGTQYIPVAGDTIRFAMKENYDDPRPLLVKDIPIDTMMLTLEPQDTADLIRQLRLISMVRSAALVLWQARVRSPMTIWLLL